MRIISEQASGSRNNQSRHSLQPPASLIAAKLAEAFRSSDTRLVYVALGETAATRIARAIQCLDPSLEMVVLPPWDCLPYDRAPPSRQSMGRRMDALRVWAQPSPRSRLLVTSLDAMLQRVPPAPVIMAGRFSVAVGDRFDRPAFEAFVSRTGYIEEGIVDEPGELVFRDELIDIFPAGATVPMRILLTEDGTVSDLRSYDPSTQRTTTSVDVMEFGPASEAIVEERDTDSVQTEVSEQRLLQLYGEMQTVFDIIGEADFVLADGADERLESYLDIIAEARVSDRRYNGADRSDSHSLYIAKDEWCRGLGDPRSIELGQAQARPLPVFAETSNPRRAFLQYVKETGQSGDRVVFAGTGSDFETLCRRVERELGVSLRPVSSLIQAQEADPGSLLSLKCALEQGFVDAGISVVTVQDVVGERTGTCDITVKLTEPDLRLGDVVVHEDHGIGVLKGLESVTVEGVDRDAARLEYRDGASILVPMEEFEKLWRYGSEPEAVTLDRLHTEAWKNRRCAIEKDIRAAARHLLRLAKERRYSNAEEFVPPRAGYAKFVRRFPYAETPHQTAAIKAVLADLASGNVMNRLICGDVGFGKTEVALRAAAAVALAGGQVVVAAPTTVLARQHFINFGRRFAGTDIKVAMLSRVVEPQQAKEVKAGIANGEIDIVVTTQAILAKDVRFAHLGLLVVDEEHRFGRREKEAMRQMAQPLHTLTMSATPIPRTLQAAMIGVQDVSILATAPSKRRPVRTSLSLVDRGTMRTALMRENRRGGQSFVVVPQIDDIDEVYAMLAETVPDLSVRVAHGKMKAPDMDAVMVGFANGEGDILLSTNIIESGLDVPRANTIFVWRADRFGLAQLHQLRGRVGRGKSQGIAYLLTADNDAISEETRLRLSTMVENDRLGAGLAISMQDLDLRGAGDIAGEDQAGHMKLIGVSLYQKLLERAVAAARKEVLLAQQSTVLNLGVAGTIPADYVAEGTVRLNLYSRLMRATTEDEIDGLVEEFEDRFGELPEEVVVLFRMAKLRLAAAMLGIAKIDVGPRAIAVTFTSKPTRSQIKPLLRLGEPTERDGRLIFERRPEDPISGMVYAERLLSGPG